MKKLDTQFDTDHLILDVRHLAPYVFDVEVRAKQGLRFEQDGFEEAIEEFRLNQANYGERAGISAQDYSMLLELLERRAEIKKHLYKARKIAEKLDESYVVIDDQIQRMVFGFATVIDARAKAFDDEDLLALYERVRAYRSAIGLKAARTRRRNEAELGAPENEELPGEPTQELPGESTQDFPAISDAR